MRQFNLAVMMYHYVRDPGGDAGYSSAIPGMPLSVFEAQLVELEANFEMIAWPQLRDELSGGRALPSRACLLTFDDGVRDHYLNVFPVLSARRLSGLFFALPRSPRMGLTLGHKIHFLIARLGPDALRGAFYDRLDALQQAEFDQVDARYRSLQSPGDLPADIDIFKHVLQRDLSELAESVLSGLIETYVGPEVEIAGEFFLNQDQILEMAAGGMHFGGHSLSHPWFDWVDDRRQSHEIAASVRWLSTFEQGPWSFAYPYGGWKASSPALLRQSGFIGAFTTRPQRTHTDPFQIGRYDAETFAPEMLRGDPAGGSG